MCGASWRTRIQPSANSVTKSIAESTPSGRYRSSMTTTRCTRCSRRHDPVIHGHSLTPRPRIVCDVERARAIGHVRSGRLADAPTSFAVAYWRRSGALAHAAT